MSKEYNKYLEEHRANVAKGFYWLIENIEDVGYYGSELERQITAEHDKSKSDLYEYGPYDNYFYNNDHSYSGLQAFNKAWLTHIHKNPHHWQYWVLHNDDPNEGMVILDMEYNYIIEMICDWWSFSWKNGKPFEIFDWYNEHKQYILLSDKTKMQVEDLLKRMYDKLVENGGM